MQLSGYTPYRITSQATSGAKHVFSIVVVYAIEVNLMQLGKDASQIATVMHGKVGNSAAQESNNRPHVVHNYRTRHFLD